MTAKVYLNQAQHIGLRIKSMTAQLESLRAAAINISPSYSDRPLPATRNVHKTEDAIISVLDMERKRDGEFVRLADIHNTISAVSDPVRQAILVNRYISCMTWAEIAIDNNISLRRVYQIHGAALKDVDIILSEKNL